MTVFGLSLSEPTLVGDTTSQPESWQLARKYLAIEASPRAGHIAYRFEYCLRLRRIVDTVGRVARGKRLLDVAAAHGTLSLTFLARGYDVTWNDIRGDLVPLVACRPGSEGLSYAPGNVLESGFPSGFDVVVAAEVLEHVADPVAFLSSLRTLLADSESRIVVTTPNGRFVGNRLPTWVGAGGVSALESRQFQPDSDGHLFLLTPMELRFVARAAGLTVECLDHFGCPLAHLIERFFPKLLHSVRVSEMLRSIDTAIARLPLSSRLTRQMIAVLRVSEYSG
jgi:2-polyprenyl-3-methyl-5-hydroxy-6-metoxy-1,4-benzoquinol methylase